MTEKLNQGTNIYIGYGFKNSAGINESNVPQKLKNMIREFPNKLFVAEYATHEKLLIVDEDIVVFGSANWLSNKRYKNSERSIVITDRDLAISEAKRAEKLIRDNLDT